MGRLLGMAYEFLEGEGVVCEAEWGEGEDPVAVAVIVADAGKDSEWDDEISCLNVSEIKNRK